MRDKPNGKARDHKRSRAGKTDTLARKRARQTKHTLNGKAGK